MAVVELRRQVDPSWAEDQRLTPAQLGAVLSVHERTLERWRDEPDYGVVGPPASKIANTILYRWGDVVAWLDSRYSGDPGVDRSGDELLTRQQAADMAAVPVSRLVGWERGRVVGVDGPPRVELSSTNFRYWRTDVDAWLRGYHPRRSGDSLKGVRRGG